MDTDKQQDIPYKTTVQHHRKGGLEAGQDHQGIHINKGKQSYFEPEYW